MKKEIKDIRGSVIKNGHILQQVKSLGNRFTFDDKKEDVVDHLKHFSEDYLIMNYDDIK